MFKGARGRGVQRLREFVMPTREWFAVLGLGCVLFLVGAGYAAYVFWSSTKIAAEAVSISPETNQVYDQKKVQKVLDTYEEKAARFKKMLEALPAQPVETVPVDEKATTTAPSPITIKEPTTIGVPIAE